MYTALSNAVCLLNSTLLERSDDLYNNLESSNLVQWKSLKLVQLRTFDNFYFVFINQLFSNINNIKQLQYHSLKVDIPLRLGTELFCHSHVGGPHDHTCSTSLLL